MNCAVETEGFPFFDKVVFVLLFAVELSSNSPGKITSNGKEFCWYSHSSSCKVARTYGIYSVSGIITIPLLS